jgi:hypothetical protein
VPWGWLSRSLWIRLPSVHHLFLCMNCNTRTVMCKARGTVTAVEFRLSWLFAVFSVQFWCCNECC